MLISIIIPTYNSDKTLGYCLDSVLSQSFNDFECLIVDYEKDSPKTKEIAFKYNQTDSRIKYYSCLKKGAVSQREYGIKRARGEYICFIDSDDVVDNNFLKIMYSTAVNNNADVIQCNKLLVQKIEDVPENNPQYKEPRVINLALRKINNVRKNIGYISLHTKMVRKELALKATSYYNCSTNYVYWEDVIFVYYCLFNSDSICLIDKILYYQINNKESVTHNTVIDMSYYISCLKLTNTLLSICSSSKHKYNKKQNTIYGVFSFISMIVENFTLNYVVFKKIFNEYRKLFKDYISLNNIRCKYSEFDFSESMLAFSLKMNLPFLAYTIIKRTK